MTPTMKNRFSILALLSLSALTGAAKADAELALGRKIFTQQAQPACALCHTLKDAGAEGAIGPVLDEIKPDAARVSRAVKDGIGAMPPFKQQLSDAEVKAVARYVSVATGAAKK